MRAHWRIMGGHGCGTLGLGRRIVHRRLRGRRGGSPNGGGCRGPRVVRRGQRRARAHRRPGVRQRHRTRVDVRGRRGGAHADGVRPRPCRDTGDVGGGRHLGAAAGHEAAGGPTPPTRRRPRRHAAVDRPPGRHVVAVVAPGRPHGVRPRGVPRARRRRARPRRAERARPVGCRLPALPWSSLPGRRRERRSDRPRGRPRVAPRPAVAGGAVRLVPMSLVAAVGAVGWPVIDRFRFGDAFAISPHGVFIAIGFMIGAWLFGRIAVARGVSEEAISSVVLWSLIGAIVGARFFYVVADWSEFAPRPIEALLVWKGGITLLGGIAGATIANAINIRRFGL